MSQLSGSWSAELDTTGLAEQIAQRVAILVTAMLRAGPDDTGRSHGSGADIYERDPGSPDPGPGRRLGARFGAVVTDRGDLEHDDGMAG